MATRTIEFYECEHTGDLQDYISDLVTCGARILTSSVDSESETGSVTIEVADDKKKDFMEKFRKTDACELSNLGEC